MPAFGIWSGHSFFCFGNHLLYNLFACHETNEAGDIFGVDELFSSHQFQFFVLGNSSFQKDTFCVQIHIPIKFIQIPYFEMTTQGERCAAKICQGPGLA